MREAAGNEPQARLLGPHPQVSQLLAVITEPPDRPDTLGHVIAEQAFDVFFLALEACRQDNGIGRNDIPVLQFGAFGDEGVDIVELDQPDLAVDDQVGAAHVEIIAAAAVHELELPARFVFVVDPEAHFFQRLQHVLVEACGFFGHCGMNGFERLVRGRGGDEVRGLQGQAFVIQGVGQLCARLDIDDAGGAPLDKRYRRPVGLQVLRHIVGAGAGADDQDAFVLAALRAGIGAGMDDLALELVERRDCRQVGDAGDAGGHNHMSRPQGAGAAGLFQLHRPAAVGLVVSAAAEFGFRPEI